MNTPRRYGTVRESGGSRHSVDGSARSVKPPAGTVAALRRRIGEDSGLTTVRCDVSILQLGADGAACLH